MGAHELVLLEDRLAAGAPALALPPVPRVVYVATGQVEVAGAGPATALAENQAWHGVRGATLAARADARIWRWELRGRSGGPADSGNRAEPGATTVKLARTITLGPGGHLMRCDRVDFPPGGVAYTHTHQGPGIRVLLRGRFRVEVGGHVTAIAPGEAWFECGPDPVYAEGSPSEPTSFIRVMVLPVALLGKRSIRYVKAEDQAWPKSQSYTVFLDAPLAG